LLIQAVDRKRCASCEHWRGWRQPGEQAGTVIIESEISEGLCQDGGWANSERRARSACGHWVRWLAIDQTIPE
jgi:hypothetical protein